MPSSSSSSEEEAVILAAVRSAAEASEEYGTRGAWGGRQKGSRGNIHRGACSWWRDYLCDEPVYPAWHFRRRFRVPLKLFRRLERDLPAAEPELQRRVDAAGRPGAFSWHKILCALCRLGDGASYHSLDDQARMSVESMRQSFRAFLSAVRKCYATEVLNRPPTLGELRTLEHEYAQRLFPGCIGALYCMHLGWKNCPKAWKGQYHNPKASKLATVQVEAMCDSDLYCWRVFCGRPGTNNDITVVENSPLILSILRRERTMHLPGGYKLARVLRDWFLYYLTDGIYPQWAIFVQPNHAPTTPKEQAMTKAQEGRRKDVERLLAFYRDGLKFCGTIFTDGATASSLTLYMYALFCITCLCAYGLAVCSRTMQMSVVWH